MGKNIIQKLLAKHLINGKLEKNQEIALKPTQLLLNDSTSVMICLEFEQLSLERAQIEKPVIYIDHNLLQTRKENAEDMRYLEDFAKKYGLFFSKPGNGICHVVHLQRFAIPGQFLVGADSHTATHGSLGMLSIGVGGMDGAAVLAGEPLYIEMPEILNIVLLGKLNNGVSAKDIILEILKKIGVKGGTGNAIEYSGPGVKTLSVTERATICNMGAELGITTSIFPSDENTYRFLKAQQREDVWTEILADKNAEYDAQIEINLAKIEPQVAAPSSPDSVIKIKELDEVKIDQVFIGSCTNCSYEDLVKVSLILRGKKISSNVSMVVSVGSRQMFELLLKEKHIYSFIEAGARILECGCGPCVGIGQVPGEGMISLKTSNRNFRGRSGNPKDKVYLSSTETAAASALEGKITDPRKYICFEKAQEPIQYPVDDSLIIDYTRNHYQNKNTKTRKGKHVKANLIFPILPEKIEGKVVLALPDNITTDDIIPADADLISLRSNIPELSKHAFERIDQTFYSRTKHLQVGIIIAGENYGQGSSREHAALVLRNLGIRIIIAKSYSRIHKKNLINFGILPLRFKNPEDYHILKQNNIVFTDNLRDQVKNDEVMIYLARNNDIQFQIKTFLDISRRNTNIILCGGLLNYITNKKNVSNCF